MVGIEDPHRWSSWKKSMRAAIPGWLLSCFRGVLDADDVLVRFQCSEVLRGDHGDVLMELQVPARRREQRARRERKKRRGRRVAARGKEREQRGVRVWGAEGLGSSYPQQGAGMATVKMRSGRYRGR